MVLASTILAVLSLQGWRYNFAPVELKELDCFPCGNLNWIDMCQGEGSGGRGLWLYGWFRFNHISGESAQWIVGACSRKCSAVENPEQHVTAEICFDCSLILTDAPWLNTHDQNLNYRYYYRWDMLAQACYDSKIYSYKGKWFQWV